MFFLEAPGENLVSCPFQLPEAAHIPFLHLKVSVSDPFSAVTFL